MAERAPRRTCSDQSIAEEVVTSKGVHLGLNGTLEHYQRGRVELEPAPATVDFELGDAPVKTTTAESRIRQARGSSDEARWHRC
jgi:hypothetical protein